MGISEHLVSKNLGKVNRLKKFGYPIVFMFFCYLSFFLILGCTDNRAKPSIDKTALKKQLNGEPLLIAHAGGRFQDMDYTNSLDALNFNYGKGFRFFELDFLFTRDGHLVLFHDWKTTYKKIFNKTAEIKSPVKKIFHQLFFDTSIDPPSLQEFMALKSPYFAKQLSITDLAQWLQQHSDAWIITDIKQDFDQALAIIKTHLGTQQVIPQIYHYTQYKRVKEMGFQDIILTLYRHPVSEQDMLEITQTYHLFAITWWHNEFTASNLADKLTNVEFVCAHTVNRKLKNYVLIKGRVNCLYTDNIMPHS